MLDNSTCVRYIVNKSVYNIVCNVVSILVYNVGANHAVNKSVYELQSNTQATLAMLLTNTGNKFSNQLL